MSLDLTILRLLRTQDRYDLYIRAVPKEVLEPHTRILLDDYGKWYAETNGAPITVEGFLSWFLLAHPKLKPEPKAMLTGIIKNTEAPVPDGVEQGILARLEDARQAAALTSMLEKYNAGEEVSVMRTVAHLAESVPMDRAALPEADFNIDRMLDDEQNDWGFSWPQDALNASMRGMRPGDFGIIGARVDVGKSSKIAHAVAHWAPQVEQLFPGEGRTIIWLNNEGPGNRLNQRLVNATLNMNMQELVDARSSGRNLWDEVLQAWGGRRVVTVYDVHDRPMSFLENIVRRTKPAIVVVDMLDNVPFDGAVGNGGQRTDQILEAAYQRSRIWAVKYDCAVLATSQLSAEAAGVLFPGMHMLANSKTGKAGAADFILMVGASDDPLLRNSRWLSLPKNKLARSGGPKDPRVEVPFDGPRSRFNNPERLQ